MHQSEWHRRAVELGYEDERDMFTKLYAELSFAQIGERLGCHQMTIRRRIGLLGIPIRARGNTGQRQPTHQLLLWHLDQQLVFGYSPEEVARLSRMSVATVFSYLSACRRIEWNSASSAPPLA